MPRVLCFPDVSFSIFLTEARSHGKLSFSLQVLFINYLCHLHVRAHYDEPKLPARVLVLREDSPLSILVCQCFRILQKLLVC